MHYIYNLRIRNTLVKYFALLGNNPHLCNIFRFVNKKNMTKNVLMSQRYIYGALVFTAKSRDLLSKENLKLQLHIFLRFWLIIIPSSFMFSLHFYAEYFIKRKIYHYRKHHIKVWRHEDYCSCIFISRSKRVSDDFLFIFKTNLYLAR